MTFQTQRVMDLQDSALYLDSEYAKSYGSGKSNFWSELCRKLVEEAELKPEDIVADLGCGTGYATREIINAGVSTVYAIDPSRAMINEANGNLDGSIVIEGTIDNLISSGLQKPTIIISSGVFVVMMDSFDTLRKVYGYLEDKGRYIFTVEDWTNANVEWEQLDSFFERVREYEQRLGIENDDLFLKGGKRYLPEEVKRMIAEAGGRITQSYSKEMSYPAECSFDYNHELSFIHSEIKTIEDILRKEGRSLGTGRILKMGKELDKLQERKRLFEEFKGLYADKKLVVGTQQVFHTANS